MVVQHNGVHRFAIIDNKVRHIEGEGCFDRIPAVTQFLQTCNLRDKTFYMNLHDNVVPEDFEVFGFSCRREHKDHPNVKLLPNLYSMFNFQGKLERVRKEDTTPFKSKPWRSAVFYGQPTGLYDVNENLRCAFCLGTKDMEATQAKITSGIQINPAQHELLRPVMGRPIAFDVQLKFAYQINIDGNSTSWDRLPWQLASNSVVLNHRGNPHWEWWYTHLLEEKHFAVCDETDIEQVIAHYESHPAFAERMIKNANEVVREHLNPDSIRKYTEQVLN
jgi:hypothetical protein